MSVGMLTGARDASAPRARIAARACPLDRYLAGLIALVVLAAALRFWRLGHQGFWFDEANTSQEIRFTPGEMVTLLKHYESTPPLYYSLAWVWGRVFGFGEVGLRSLSAVCGVLVVPLAYWLGSKLFSARAGLIAAALTASNPLLIWYSQEARAYELSVLLAAASLVAFVYARDNPTPRAAAAWAAASALALATEYYVALVVVPEAAWLLCAHRRRRAVLLSIAAVVIWSMPLLWFALSQNATGHASWIAPIPLGPRIAQIFPQFLIGFGAPAGTTLAPVAGACAVVALALLAVEPRRVGRGAPLLGGLLAGGVLVNALLIAIGIDNLLTRNVIAMWLPVAVLVGGGLAVGHGRPAGGGRLAGGGRFVGGVLAAVLCGIGVTAAVGVALEPKLQRPDWRGVARALGPPPARAVAARAILIQNYRDVLPLSLYMPHLRAWHHTGTDKYSHYTGTYSISELDVIAISSPPAPPTGCWWGSACNLVASSLQRSYPVAGFRAVGIRRWRQFTILRMVAPRPVALTPQLVSRALTNTRLMYDDLLVQSAAAAPPPPR